MTTDITAKPFETDLQAAVFYNTYARWNPTLGRRETWTETVERVCGWMQNHINTTYVQHGLPPAIPWDELRQGMLDLQALPSMRLVQMAGPSLDRCHVGAYNCAYLPLQDWRTLSELLYILMQGTGCGFSVEQIYVDRFTDIKPQDSSLPVGVHYIKDTTEGWCDALHEGLVTWANGGDVEFDYSAIRPYGAPLATKGGRASGPEPLRQLLDYARTMLLRHQGRKLSSLNLHDLACYCGSIVQVGGVRRSAEISLSDLHDSRMATAKQGQFWLKAPERSMANNSAVYTSKPDLRTFANEWLTMIENETGERGLFNRGDINKWLPKRREHRDDWGVNPCVTGDTFVLTNKGHIPIKSLVGKRTAIWNGYEYSEVTPYETGVRAIYRVELTSGQYLDCTDNHEWVMASGERIKTIDLLPDMALTKVLMPVVNAVGDTPDLPDAYSQGFYSGDGNGGYTWSHVYEPKYDCIPRLVGDIAARPDNYGRRRWVHGKLQDKNWVPLNESLVYRLEWLAGLLDADGTVLQNPNSIMLQISSIDKVFLQRTQLMLTGMGVQAKIGLMKTASDCGIDGYTTQDCWRLCINASDVGVLLQYGLTCSRLNLKTGLPNRDARRFVRIKSVSQLFKQEMTYCFTEQIRHMGTFNGIVTGQCGEIILRPFQFCNLSIAVARPDDDLSVLTNKVRLAAIWGTLQSTLTRFAYIRPEWQQNCEQERLLGVDITGQMDNQFIRSEVHRANVYNALRSTARTTNETYADLLGIPRSAAVTCVKPSGNSSQLLNVSSGIHPRYAPYYIRRIRIGTSSPLCGFLKAAGVPGSPEVGQVADTATVWVFEFPVKSPNGALCRQAAPASIQLQQWLACKQFYTEHNPSCTIYVKPEEWLEVASWVYNHWDMIGGLSFLPYDGGVYQLAPYEAIEQSDYEKRLNKWPQLEWAKLAEFETQDTTEVNREYACSGDKCEW